MLYLLSLALGLVAAQGESDIELATPPPSTPDGGGEEENKLEKSNPAEFIRYECAKTAISIFIPKWTVGGARASPDLVTLASGNEWCRANHFNKTHFNIELDLINAKRTCGTQRTTQGVEIIYENKIVWNNREERVIEDLANVTCRQFLEEKHVHLSMDKSMNTFDVEDRNYAVNMSLFETNDYSKPFTGFEEDGYVHVKVGEFIYVQIGFDVADEEEEKTITDTVVVEQCYGSRSSNPDNIKSIYSFIESGCVSDNSVIIRKNGMGPRAEFLFQMYKWKAVAQHEQFIYLHCRAWVCAGCQRPELTHSCYGDITAFRKRRRRRVALWNDETIPSPYAKVFSVGPIYPKDHKPLLNDRPKGPHQSVLKPTSEVVENLTPEQEEDNIVQAIIIGSVSGFCGLFLLIVLVVFIRKYKERPFNFCAEIKTEEQEDEKKIEQGFVFELRSSTDPVIPRLNIEQFRPRHDDIKEESGANSNKPKMDRKDFHGSKMSIDRSQRDDRGRRNRDRSKSRDRDRGDRERSQSRRRGTSRDRGGDRDRDRSRDRTRDRSRSRDRSGRDRSKVRRSDSRSGSRGDVRGSRADLSGDKMKRSRSRTSLAEKRLSPLTEDKLSSAEQEPSGMKRSESKSSINKEKRGGRSASRMRRSESKTSVAGGGGGDRESRDRTRRDRSKSRQRGESKDRRHRSPSRDGRRERSESKVRERSESKVRERSESKARGGERKERGRRSPSRARGKRSPSRNRDKSGSKADLSSSRDRGGSKMDLRDVDRKNGRRKMNRQKDLDPEQEFSAL